jgi:hypothetical protein
MKPDQTEISSPGEFIEVVTPVMEWKPSGPLSAKELLRRMRSRVEVYGTPLPEGYVPPPGIDLDALLKQVPWPPPADA